MQQLDNLMLLETFQIHPVFHASQNKKAIGSHVVRHDVPHGLEVEEPIPMEPEANLAPRTNIYWGKSIHERLILWMYNLL